MSGDLTGLCLSIPLDPALDNPNIIDIKCNDFKITHKRKSL